MADTPGVEERARAVLDPWVYDYYAGGAGDEATLAANVTAWRRVPLRPRVLRDVTTVSARTRLLGTEVATPVGIAPTAFHALAHPDGEVATARAAKESGALLVLSTRSSRPIEEVAPVLAGAPWWFQVYVLRDRELTRDLVAQAAAYGARALVLTGDTPYLSRRRQNPDPALFPDRIGEQATDVTFDAIGWLAETSRLPVVVKGVLRDDDARACAAAGAAAVWVSNHGGRQLDGAVATAEALPHVVDGLAGCGLETYVDGGIRRGVDVLRALALGADAVFVGRSVLWGLATGGAAGAGAELSALAADVELSMGLAGATSVGEITRDLVWSAPVPGIR